MSEKFFAAVQLEQLCQAQEIEHTLHLLFSLNHWAKARERLFYADRQGLYAIKGAILRHAYLAGFIEARGYIDGIEGFGAELAYDMAANVTAESVLWRLEELVDLPASAEQNEIDQIACQFYTRMTGKKVFTENDLAALQIAQIQEYIVTHLRELEQKARAIRQPIPSKKLMELCLAPSDLLCIQDQRHYDLADWDRWDLLDSNDLRKLDPEGLSLIAFGYTSPTANYVFHMPFRLAEAFLPADRISELRNAPTASREQGEYYGRAITEAESLQQPIAEILGELSVNISNIYFPRLLSNKQEYVHLQAMRYTAWNDHDDFDDDEDELDEEFWQDLCPPSREKKSQPPVAQCKPDQCPLCHTRVTPETVRAEHWQQKHPNLDLTFSQARWVLNSEIIKKQFCQLYPPDYRGPHERGWGTRYWRIATLAEWVKECKPNK
jgi:hypothetical protein